MSAQADFSAALLTPTAACPPGLKSWNGSDPEKRFAIYRNNVVVSLVDALADSYPVVQALVGEEFFRAMARQFVQQSPPRSPVLAWYGERFGEFIAGFPPAGGVPYLADMAGLEWLRVEAWHAADAVPLPLEHLAALLADADLLSQTRFTLHPALRGMTSAYPLVSLWAAHQRDDQAAALAAIDMTEAESAVLLRPALEVEILRIEPAATDFIRHLQAGVPFGQAVAATADFDLPATLGRLLRAGAIVGYHSSETPT